MALPEGESTGGSRSTRSVNKPTSDMTACAGEAPYAAGGALIRSMTEDAASLAERSSVMLAKVRANIDTVVSVLSVEGGMQSSSIRRCVAPTLS